MKHFHLIGHLPECQGSLFVFIIVQTMELCDHKMNSAFRSTVPPWQFYVL